MKNRIPGSVYELHQGLAALDREALEARVRVLAATGVPEHDIAALTSLSVEQVRRILAGPSLTLTRGGAQS
jgi:hypothetical protein